MTVLLAGAACTPAPPRPQTPSHRGPIVLITLEGLRADGTGGLGGQAGATPNLDQLIAEAEWAGRGVAASSWVAPAMASIFTGLAPWQHQVLHSDRARLHRELHTLPEALSRLGYRTTAYCDGPWLTAGNGYGQGFDAFHPLGQGKRAGGHLSSLRDRRDFLWIHIQEPQAPYIRRDWLPPAREGHLPAPLGLPRRLGMPRLEQYFDPAVPLPDGERRIVEGLYRYDVAWADERLRRLLEALRTSGHWDETLLVVTSSHGQELGEHQQMLDGGHLGRELLEVPLIVKLPAGFGRPLPDPSRRAATARLWATLVAAAGGTPPPAVAPSLFERGEDAILSEVYLDNGANQFSLLEGDLQLLLKVRFAAPEPRYFDARLANLGRPPGRPLTEPPAAIFDRLTRAFARSLPLSGGGIEAPELTLERWTGASGTLPVVDPAVAREMHQRLIARWSSFLNEELAPAEEARYWRDRTDLRPRRR